MRFVWTDEIVNSLREQWAKGFSASYIAENLCRDFKVDITRNAVIGKLHRVGLSSENRRTAVRRKKKTNENKKVEMIKPVSLFDVTDERFHQKPNLMDLKNNMCRFPVGDPRREDFHFCGLPTIIGESYCEHHKSVVYIKTVKK